MVLTLGCFGARAQVGLLSEIELGRMQHECADALSSEGIGGGVTARAQRAHERKKFWVFATIGNILACTDHTTPPQCWIASCFTPSPPPKPPKATAHRDNGHRVSEVGHVGYDYNGSSG